MLLCSSKALVPGLIWHLSDFWGWLCHQVACYHPKSLNTKHVNYNNNKITSALGLLFHFDFFSKNAEVFIPRFPFHNLTCSCSLCLCVCVCLAHTLPRSRLQYSLDVADRLADEHVLIGVYVNMLQSSPARLVQVWHLWGTQQRDLAQPNALTVSSWPRAGAALHEH